MTLREIADQLNAAADELEARCRRGDGSPMQEHLWARHLREDAKGIRLLAEATEEPIPA